MMNRPSAGCENLTFYFVYELNGKERDEFEQHLKTCAKCMDELKGMEQVWNSLPLCMEEIEPPADLKEQVFSSLFPNEFARKPRTSFERIDVSRTPESYDKHKRDQIRWKALWNSTWTKAAVLFLFVGLSWNNLELRDELSTVENRMSSPAQMVQTYTIASADPSMANASGNAWIIQSGDQKRLVVNINGLRSTQGNEVYQVWIVRNGERLNAGTFRVSEKGNGILTYTMRDQDVEFDQIGVTLEPDPYGDQPRGRKVLGTI